jgi:hypothetical protein
MGISCLVDAPPGNQRQGLVQLRQLRVHGFHFQGLGSGGDMCRIAQLLLAARGVL